jgi:hypothetical protein
MLKKIQATSSDVVFFINSKKFKKHTLKRKEQNITLNVNLVQRYTALFINQNIILAVKFLQISFFYSIF